MDVKKYVSKPVEIEAAQFDGTRESYLEFEAWIGPLGGDISPFIYDAFSVKTLEGDMKVSKGDWVIRGTIGEFYPCKDEVFQRKYAEIV